MCVAIVPGMNVSRWFGWLVAASLMMGIVACKSGGGGGGGDGGGSGGSAGTGGEVQIGALTHCDAPAFHCIWPSTLFKCAEYSSADASSYESLCKQGGGKWSAGYCSETGVVGQCLALNHCKGMGIGFHGDAATEADAKQSCADTGGTWQTPMP